MKKKLQKKSEDLFEKSTKLKFILPILLLMCFLAYGLSLDMYFWKDDFALMIKAQKPELPVGFFGPGIKGDGAYRYITLPFSLLYPYFQLNTGAYFFVGILLYFFASLGVFVLAEEIFQDRFKAFLVSSIFSSGFVGADSIFGLTNSYQTSWVIFFLALSLTLFLRSFRKKDLGMYILSVFVFAISLETGFVRAHGFFLIVASMLFLLIENFSFRKVFGFVLRIIPFFLIFKTYYLNSTTSDVGSSQLSQSFKTGNYDYFLNPLFTFLNVLIPTPLIKHGLVIFNDLFGRNTGMVKFQIGLLIILLFLFVGLFIFLLKRGYFRDKNSQNLKNLGIVLFSLLAILSSFIGVFFIGAAATYLDTTHRYLSTSFIGLAFFWVSLFSLLFSKTKNGNGILLPVALICLLYILLGNIYALESIDSRTKPQKEFFSQLKKELPQIKEKTFLYFDVSNKNNSQGKFGQIFGAGSVGGSPEITMHYPGVDRYDVTMSIADFQDFLKKVNEGKGSVDNSYAFYFEDNQLTNNTAEFRNILQNGKSKKVSFEKDIQQESKLIKKNGESILENTSLEINFPQNLLTITDSILKFNLEIIPQEFQDENLEDLSPEDKTYLEYLIAKNNIKKHLEVNAFNYFQNQIPENLIDDKIDTTWMAGRGPWHNMQHGISDDIQYIEFKLAQSFNLGGILFTNGHTLRTPTAYKILVKENGSWLEVRKTEFNTGKGTNEIWFDKIDPVLASEVRIEFLKSISGDAPQLAEIELIDSKFSDLDFKKAKEIELDPSVLLTKNPNSSLIKDYFSKNGKISFTYLSNKDNDYNVPSRNIEIQGLDQTHSYEVSIPANGTQLVKVKFFNLNFPAKYIFSDFEFINPPLSYYHNENKQQ